MTITIISTITFAIVLTSNKTKTKVYALPITLAIVLDFTKTITIAIVLSLTKAITIVLSFNNN